MPYEVVPSCLSPPPLFIFFLFIFSTISSSPRSPLPFPIPHSSPPLLPHHSCRLSSWISRLSHFLHALELKCKWNRDRDNVRIFRRWLSQSDGPKLFWQNIQILILSNCIFFSLRLCQISDSVFRHEECVLLNSRLKMFASFRPLPFKRWFHSLLPI